MTLLNHFAYCCASSQLTSRMGKFFAGLPWHELVPDTKDRIIARGAGDGAGRAVAALNEAIAILYVPGENNKPRELTLDLSSFSHPVKAQWFNPAAPLPAPSSTLEAPIINQPLPNTTGQAILTPGDNGTGAGDWVLFLDAR